MPRLTKRDRHEILALKPAFRRDLTRLTELRQRPPSVNQLFSKNPTVRQKANQDQQERQTIEERMRTVGLPSPPAPAMFVDGWKRHEISPVQPHMRATRISTTRSSSKREDGKEINDRKSVSKMEYDLKKNQFLTIDIDISADTPNQLSKLVHDHIKKARKQLGFIRDRSSNNDDWAIWKAHRLEGESVPQIARELSGRIGETARNNETLHARTMSIRRSIKRINEKIKMLPYPPAPSRYSSPLRSSLQ